MPSITISSRTPEGSFNRCPICGAVVRLEVSQPVGDATCPACGALIWYFAADSGIRLFDPADPKLQEFLRAFLVETLGVSPNVIGFRDGVIYIEGIDSLDMAELLLELDLEFPLYDGDR